MNTALSINQRVFNYIFYEEFDALKLLLSFEIISNWQVVST